MATAFPNITKHLRVEFDKPVRPWDGFGFNYVEVSQSIDYDSDPQEYGGFSLLTDAQRSEILDLVFGPNGLRPGTMKMFLDPFHQTEENLNPSDATTIDQSNYNHERTTQWMRFFVKEGVRRTGEQGGALSLITTLFGPPPFMTKQKVMRGRDLDPKYLVEMAKYIAAWAQFCREEEGIPVDYIGFHNEGEDLIRWPEDGSSGNIGDGHDYNLLSPPEQVVELIKAARPILNANGMKGVGIAPGETTNWLRFWQFGYADAIADDKDAVAALGLISSHGFTNYNRNIWFADHRSVGIDTIRAHRPDLHAWVTSTSWSKMDPFFVYECFNNIYSAKANAIIPWAGVQVPNRWVGGDPNPGSAIHITEDGTYKVLPGYYYYKQIAPIGQPGMAVARIRSDDTQLPVIAFSSNGTVNPDAFAVVSLAEEQRPAEITVRGAREDRFSAYRTSEQGERCDDLGEFAHSGGTLRYEVPPMSVTTFVARSRR
jgi:hypothetical protein